MGEVVSLPQERNPFDLVARRIRRTESQEDLDLIAEAIGRGGFTQEDEIALDVLVARRRRELFRGDTPPGGRAA